MGRINHHNNICSKHKSPPHIEGYDSRRILLREETQCGTLKNICVPVYIHIPKDKRKKLGRSGKKGIFVGYSEYSKAYRIYIL
jgi:hypothetical protein